MPAINIVWLKRDIRTQDQAALHAAEQAGIPYLVIYCFEPELMAYPDTSLRHLQFVYHSLMDFNEKLHGFGRQAEIFHAEAVEMFAYMIKHFAVRQVFSYQESGTQITWERDKAVGNLLRENTVKWTEFQRDGIVRGIKNRKGWDKKWYQTMSQPIIQNRFSKSGLPPLAHPFPLEKGFLADLQDYPQAFQPAGESFAWKYLHSFTRGRGSNFHRHISKPTESRLSCSRLSPFLAWGNLSIRQAVQHVRFHPEFPANKRAFTGMLTRLKWHCHFIQKFEVECAYETACINRGYELLERQPNSAYVAAWKAGKTGIPLVDACMRCLHETGWVNFRMRAMLVSILCHQLDQDWRSGMYHLAQLFLDYEPGIHYPQFQMQAGTTGVNIIRMYNPVKQSQDHDPEGIFIKKWVPELRDVPVAHMHAPWEMTALEQSFCGVMIGKDYPAPLVDLKASARSAREKIWGHRAHPKVKSEGNRIVRTHTVRRKSRRKTT